MTSPAAPQSRIIPNSFQMPNLLVDDLQCLLTGNEFKLVTIICRKTFGWHKRSDRISKSQLIELSGLGDATVDECMIALVKYGIVVRVSENVNNAGVEWAIQSDDSKIDFDGLQQRDSERREKNIKKTAAIRSKRSKGGDVEHTHHVEHEGGGDVQHEGGGDVEHPPQKPFKAITTTTTGNSAFGFSSYPENMLEANQHPAIQLYRAVSGVFPGQPYYVPICDALQLIASLKNISDIQSMKDYLQPFWLAWSTRCGTNGQQYNQLNPAWLTEWAVGGQIPPAQGDKKHAPAQSTRGQNTRSDQPAAPNYSDADRRAAERIKARKRQNVSV